MVIMTTKYATITTDMRVGTSRQLREAVIEASFLGAKVSRAVASSPTQPYMVQAPGRIPKRFRTISGLRAYLKTL